MSKILTYAELGVRELDGDIIEFTVKPEHLKLLRHLQVAYTDVDGAIIDPLKPYGSKAIEGSVATILADFGPYTDQELQRLHVESALALQICLRTGKFKAATFRSKRYQQNWKEYKGDVKRKRSQAESVDGEEAGPPDAE